MYEFQNWNFFSSYSIAFSFIDVCAKKLKESFLVLQIQNQDCRNINKYGDVGIGTGPYSN